jgi:hypothetical protein
VTPIAAVQKLRKQQDKPPADALRHRRRAVFAMETRYTPALIL